MLWRDWRAWPTPWRLFRPKLQPAVAACPHPTFLAADLQEQYARLKELARAQGVQLPPSIQGRQQQQHQQVASPRHEPSAAAPAPPALAQVPAQRVAQLQQQLVGLQQQLQQQVAQAAATAAQLPALLQPIYLEQRRQALQAGYKQQRDALQAQLQEAYRQQALAALSAAASQAQPASQQQVAWQARQGQLQQRRAQSPTPPKQAPQQEQRAAAPSAAELPPGVPETVSDCVSRNPACVAFLHVGARLPPPAAPSPAPRLTVACR